MFVRLQYLVVRRLTSLHLRWRQITFSRIIFFTGVDIDEDSSFAHVLTEKIGSITLQASELATKLPKEQLHLIATHYVDKLYRYVRYTFSLPQVVAEDIVQDLFLTLPQKLVKLDPQGNFEAYLYRITHNFAIDCLRKHAKSTGQETQLPEEQFISNIQQHPTEDLPLQIEQLYKDSLLKVVLAKMSQKNREIILLYYLEQKSYDEIALILGTKKSGIGTMLARAKQELQVKIEENTLLKEAIIMDI